MLQAFEDEGNPLRQALQEGTMGFQGGVRVFSET